MALTLLFWGRVCGEAFTFREGTMKTSFFALLLAGLSVCAAGAEAPEAAGAEHLRSQKPPAGEFTIITARRASDVTGGPLEEAAAERNGPKVIAEAGPSIRDRFPDYQPKKTPDTLLDYRPSLAAEVAMLPAEKLENLKALIQALRAWSRRADENPGAWEEGNVALGANPQEYAPSDPELIISEICERIRRLVLHTDSKKLSDAIQEQNVKVRKIAYIRFTFRHVDVMGSGRFFYASPPQQAIIKIKTAD